MEPLSKETIAKFMPYVLEVRRRLLFIVAALVVSSAIGFIYYEKIVFFFLKLVGLQSVNLVFTSPFQFMDLAVGCSLTVGLVVITPLVVYQIVSFLKPALKPREYRITLAFLPISIILFIMGFFFGVTMMKFVLALFYQKATELQIGNILDISQILSTIMFTSSLLGLAFQFPIILTVLLRFKVIKSQSLSRQRPFIYFASVVFAALMPPTDMFSLLLLTMPLVILFELTLLLNKLLKKRG